MSGCASARSRRAPPPRPGPRIHTRRSESSFTPASPGGAAMVSALISQLLERLSHDLPQELLLVCVEALSPKPRRRRSVDLPGSPLARVDGLEGELGDDGPDPLLLDLKP